MDELQRGFEIAGTGVGVVFAALVSLAVVTTLLGRLLRGVEREPAPDSPLPASASEDGPSAAEVPDESRADPMMVAAMAMAVRFVRRGPGASARRQSSETPGAWRAQGRQQLMASQGVRPRNSRD